MSHQHSSSMADATPIAFGLFAFALTVYGVRFVGVDAGSLHGATSDALNYALLAAGLGQTLGGVLAIVRGANSYAGWVTSIFGIWLIGFFMLLTHEDEAAASDPGILSQGPDGSPLPDAVTEALKHANVTAWHAESVAWYVLVLLIPVAILSIPAIFHRNIPFVVAFVAIIVAVVLLGLANHGVYATVTDVTRGEAKAPDLDASVNMLKGSAYAAFVASAAVFWIFAREVVQQTQSPHAD
jgi:hypothetical protein